MSSGTECIARKCRRSRRHHTLCYHILDCSTGSRNKLHLVRSRSARTMHFRLHTGTALVGNILHWPRRTHSYHHSRPSHIPCRCSQSCSRIGPKDYRTNLDGPGRLHNRAFHHNRGPNTRTPSSVTNNLTGYNTPPENRPDYNRNQADMFHSSRSSRCHRCRPRTMVGRHRYPLRTDSAPHRCHIDPHNHRPRSSFHRNPACNRTSGNKHHPPDTRSHWDTIRSPRWCRCRSSHHRTKVDRYTCLPRIGGGLYKPHMCPHNHHLHSPYHHNQGRST